ncbi:membrane dipeptidase [Sphingobium algorifonticola]|uniref:Membrane dipeptidase n=2 Tax=Sphingobium algorifonticola TaxID=2008318 RepID=A0A437J6H1_9SPHN|nr:membrane dipeptidase [Sphingobium algorifonticola]
MVDATRLGAARELVARHLVWDNHGCMPLRWADDSFLPQLARYRAAGVNVASLNVGYGELGIEDTVRMVAAFRHWLKARPDDYVLATSVADIHRARREGKLAVTFDIEGTRAIGDQISLIQLYHDLGVRWMLMAYNRRNLVGDGVHDEDAPVGLTPFGRDVVAEMERVGMVVCCSHTGARTAADVLAVARKPVIFSHSNPKAVWDHKRNISDDLMRACADTGGVVGITGVGAFLGANNDVRSETFVRHIDYAVNLIGVDHVGLGLDFVFDREELRRALVEMRHTFPDDPAYRTVPDFVAPEQIVEIAALLMARGYAEADIAKILGGNHLRVAEQAWSGEAAA